MKSLKQSTFADRLSAAKAQRLSFVFVAVELPEDATEAEK